MLRFLEIQGPNFVKPSTARYPKQPLFVKTKRRNTRKRRHTCTREIKSLTFPLGKQYWTGYCWPVCHESFFLSLVLKTQPNHWTKRMVNTRSTCWVLLCFIKPILGNLCTVPGSLHERLNISDAPRLNIADAPVTIDIFFCFCLSDPHS